MTWDGRTLSDSEHKYVPSNGGAAVTEPLFVSQGFIAPVNGSVTVRYPLLKVD